MRRSSFSSGFTNSLIGLTTIVVGSSVFAILFAMTACSRGRKYVPDFHNVGAYAVVGENCHTDDRDNYWVLDCTVRPDSPQIGDTITIDGIQYLNAVKVKGVDPFMRKPGFKISIDYKVVSAQPVTDANCEADSATVYPLKELTIIRQGEIR